ncbi:homoserine O-succinyltransferase MetX [Vulcaniibacterium gelatinicum]|uniref:homoserine O-succinyltransferase MetX n=1 Tax=Vulcaniibacterium gelatinicum TaxID=2598725 RepID=UPI0011C92A41|nr:homoserine O-succinyltransferase [Vulcaniibacterium gelatinicum]
MSLVLPPRASQDDAAARCPAFDPSPDPVPDAAGAAAAHAFRAERGEVACTLTLRHAGTHAVRLRWEALGEPGLPVVFVAGGISAHRHLAAHAQDLRPGWWQAQVGVDRALDPREYRLLACDWLGADGAPDAVIDPADQADAIAALLDALGIARLHAFVGCSYGAMVGLQFAARHGARLARLAAIAGSHRAHPYASAWRALQRRALALGALQCDEPQGLALARQLALLSYRTPEEFAVRFGRAQVVQGRVRADAEGWLDHCAAKYVAATPAAAFLRLSESIDLQDVRPEDVAVPATLVAVAQDRLVPVEDMFELAERLRGPARLQVLQSRYGHDAFLKEEAAIAAVLRQALAQEVAA